MFTIPNQSSIPKAYTQFTSEGGDCGSRLMSGGNRDRLVDCMEEFVKYTIVMRPYFALFGDRFSEREERNKKVQSANESEIAVEQKQDKHNIVEKQDEVNGVQVGKI